MPQQVREAEVNGVGSLLKCKADAASVSAKRTTAGPHQLVKRREPKRSKHVDRSSVACRTKLAADAAAKGDVNAASQRPCY